MPANFELERRLTRLRNEMYYIQRKYGGDVRIDKTDATWLYLSSFPLPPGWNKRIVQLLLDIPSVPVSYPQAAPQWFWVDHDLRHRDGTSLDHLFPDVSTARSLQLLQKGWGHYCLHITSWYPNYRDVRKGDNLLSYLDVLSEVFSNRKYR